VTEALGVAGPFDMRGRNAIVTGAGSGIGRATVEMLVAGGARVLGIGARPPLDGPIDGASYEVIDVRDREAMDAATAQFAAGGGIDVLVTSAGVYGDGRPIDELEPEAIEEVLDVNVLGTIWAVRAAIPHLRLSQGSVVLVGSIAGRMGGVLSGAHYAASKGAVHSLVRSLANAEIAHGVRVNGVLPGPIATPMVEGRGYDATRFPTKRWGTPDELAQSIVFLASSLSSYTTGVLLDVNGGLYMG
jgi:NAD(P)-dependent dehydrogenase (short-subunit alcohol dehydrogenase family)